MNTRERLNQHIANQNLGSDNADFAEAIRFLCAELDRLQPAKVCYKLCSEDARVPAYQTEGASGLDLHARAIQVDGYEQLPLCSTSFTLNPGSSVMVWAGVAFSIPQGWEIQVRPRSSMSKKLIHAALGTIDSDYRGEIGVLLINLGKSPLLINKGDRVAQAVFAPVRQFELERVEQLDETKRGSKGFGSSGI